MADLVPIDIPPQAVTGQVCSPIPNGNEGYRNATVGRIPTDITDIGRPAHRSVGDDRQRLGGKAELGGAKVALAFPRERLLFLRPCRHAHRLQMRLEALDQGGVRQEVVEPEGNGELRPGLGSQRGAVRKLPRPLRGRLDASRGRRRE